MLLHLAFPAVLWLMTRSAAIALGLSFLLYLMVQLFGWGVPSWPGGEYYFNPLAWQLLLVFGAWYACRGDVLRAIMHSRAVLVLAALYLACSLVIVLSWQFKTLEGFVPAALSKLIYPIDKSHLAPLRVVHFFALAIMVARLMPWDWRGLVNPLTVAMIRCGEYSLATYCFGVLLAILAHVILVEISGGLAMQFAVSLGGIALMIAAANLVTRAAKLDRHGPKLF